ncbi:hypothetical protein RND71_003048 [Anisodus tanguticus]|uniref:Uncharacterized protein n=1 Tax=Anisodus tanguticus TaxID=243964 RepID=A0AAE1SV70_9SOLA|nr:hypothetical protein RND71_003048 [Anisodus tanguticus]
MTKKKREYMQRVIIGASDEQLDVFKEVWITMLLNSGQSTKGKRLFNVKATGSNSCRQKSSGIGSCILQLILA